MDNNMNVIINQPDPNNFVLPPLPFTIANVSQEAFLVGLKIENGKELYMLTNISTGSIITLDKANIKLLLAQKNYSIAKCNITVDL